MALMIGLKRRIYNRDKQDAITISMEEYKELLIIKGKYEELKGIYTPPLILKEPTLTRTIYGSGEPIPESPYKITCKDL